MESGSLPLAAAEACEAPLSPEDVAQFARDGYCLLKAAFPRDVALACRGAVWRHIGETCGIHEGDVESWAKAPKGRLGLAEIFRGDDLGAPWRACWSPRLRKALDQLCGAGRWVDDDDALGCGWWVVTFPGVARAPWGAEGSWHVDGHGYDHRADSAEIGALPIFLFSDVEAGGGGTALAPGSHRTVAELLVRAGDAGVNGPRLSALARDALEADLGGDLVVETRGRAGDVMLTHPFLLHARSKNLRPVDADTVRFMCHPAVGLRERLRVRPRDDDDAATPPSPVEAPVRDVRRALEASEPDGIRPLDDAPHRKQKKKKRADAAAGEDDAAMMRAMGFAGFGAKRNRRR